jgi:ribosome biogenesis GTPase / thiamine phosphate phosphatase
LCELKNQIKCSLEHLPVVFVSNETKDNIEDLRKMILKGKTYCMLGSSGVGKSSLINSLTGQEIMKTGEISESIDRGKHVTTHRELIPLINGAILIDNPGMREVGVTDSINGIESTFEKIYELAKYCKFTNCTHTNEVGCAVLNALATGELEERTLQNFYKMQREQAYFLSTVKERRIKGKKLAKKYREVMKFHKKKNM